MCDSLRQRILTKLCLFLCAPDRNVTGPARPLHAAAANPTVGREIQFHCHWVFGAHLPWAQHQPRAYTLVYDNLTGPVVAATAVGTSRGAPVEAACGRSKPVHVLVHVGRTVEERCIHARAHILVWIVGPIRVRGGQLWRVGVWAVPGMGSTRGSVTAKSVQAGYIPCWTAGWATV